MAAIVDVVVDRRDGEVVVRWTRAGAGGPVRISVGRSPEDVDHANPVAVVAEGDEAVLRGLDPRVRHYVHVGTSEGAGVVAAERLVPLEGTMNFRDLGGYQGDDGRRVRWGRVFRSDGLAALSDADLEYLRALGIRTVHDFRHAGEREQAPSRIPADAGWRLVDLAIGEAASESPDLLARVLSGDVTEVGVEAMVEIYVGLVEDHATTFGRLLGHLADPDGLPALFHCTAGKDRTGIAAALLLAVLGVDETAILDDYELSTRFRSVRRIEELRPRLEAVGVDVDAVRPFLSAPRPALAAVLAHVEDRYGGVTGYLAGPAGVEPEALRRLRHLLLA